MTKLISGRVVVKTPLEVASDLSRYEFLGLAQAEPNLGIPPPDAGQPGKDYFLFSYPDGTREWRLPTGTTGPTGPTGADADALGITIMTIMQAY